MEKVRIIKATNIISRWRESLISMGPILRSVAPKEMSIKGKGCQMPEFDK